MNTRRRFSLWPEYKTTRKTQSGIWITRLQARVLLGSLLPLGLLVAFVPVYQNSDFISGTFYLPFAFAADRVRDTSDHSVTIWPLYVLHLCTGGALLASALRRLRLSPASRSELMAHMVVVIFIVAYYALAIISIWFANHGFGLILFMLNVYSSPWDTALWCVCAIAFTISAVWRKLFAARQGATRQLALRDDPMRDRWVRSLCNIARFIRTRPVGRFLAAACVAALLMGCVTLWRAILGAQLVDAATHNSIGRADVLIRLGADCRIKVFKNYDDNTGLGGCDTTALDEAISRNSLALVQSLVNGGARISAQDGALCSAVGSGDIAMVRLLIEHCDGPLDSCLLYDALPRTEIFDLLRQHGADPNVVHGHGHTALSIAAQSGDYEGVKFLLEHGAQINARDNDGWTSILCAAYVEQREMVRFLYRNGSGNSLQCAVPDDYGNQQGSMDQAKQTIRETLASLDKRHGSQ